MSELSLTEQQNLRTVVETYFGRHNTAHWDMNGKLLEVITKMISAEKSCSTAMDYVPRPGMYLIPKDVGDELKRMAKRILSGGATYWICRETAKSSWREAAEIAAVDLK